jgi:hypothetical protein
MQGNAAAERSHRLDEGDGARNQDDHTDRFDHGTRDARE